MDSHDELSAAIERLSPAVFSVIEERDRLRRALVQIARFGDQNEAAEIAMRDLRSKEC